MFPNTKTNSTGKNSPADYKTKSIFGAGYKSGALPYDGDSGSASRFFYCAKASKKDRNEGLEEFEDKIGGAMVANTGDVMELGGASLKGEHKQIQQSKNNHPTVKPTDLMRYLVRLITPKGGTVLDPFMGSGSTGKACKLEGFDFIGIEKEEEYIKIAEARINSVEDRLL